jgi:hypothetical protein
MTRPIRRGYPFPKGLRMQPPQMSVRQIREPLGKVCHAASMMADSLPELFDTLQRVVTEAQEIMGDLEGEDP